MCWDWSAMERHGRALKKLMTLVGLSPLIGDN
jgi:hypothetical protein